MRKEKKPFTCAFNETKLSTHKSYLHKYKLPASRGAYGACANTNEKTVRKRKLINCTLLVTHQRIHLHCLGALAPNAMTPMTMRRCEICAYTFNNMCACVSAHSAGCVVYRHVTDNITAAGLSASQMKTLVWTFVYTFRPNLKILRFHFIIKLNVIEYITNTCTVALHVQCAGINCTLLTRVRACYVCNGGIVAVPLRNAGNGNGTSTCVTHGDLCKIKLNVQNQTGLAMYDVYYAMLYVVYMDIDIRLHVFIQFACARRS